MQLGSLGNHQIQGLRLFLLCYLSHSTHTGRSGHGGEVKCVDWHPCTSLLASCGRDAMVKLWDARHSPDSAMLATLSGHKQAVNKVGEASYPAEQTLHVFFC